MENNKNSGWVRYLGLTAQLLVMIGLSLYVGIKLDEWLKIHPILTIALPLLTLVVTFYKLIKETGRNDKKNGSK